MTTVDHITSFPFKKLSLEGAGFKNPRTSIDPRTIAELAASIAERGLMTPLRVWTPLEDPELHVIIAGSRRYLAIERLVAEKKCKDLAAAIPCILVNAEMRGGSDPVLAARADALTDNIQRENLTSFEIATEITAFRESGLKLKEIASLLGKSEAWASRSLSSFRDASEAVKSAWKVGKLPDDDVQTLAKLRTENEAGKAVPDHVEMDKRLDKILTHRAAATPKKSSAQARQAARGKDDSAPTPSKPKVDLILQFVLALEKAPKAERYLHGVRDGLRFSIGDLGPGEFGKEFATYATKQGFLGESQPEPTATVTKSARRPAERLGAAKKGKDGWKVVYSTDVDGVTYTAYYSSRAFARVAAAGDKVGENGRVA